MIVIKYIVEKEGSYFCNTYRIVRNDILQRGSYHNSKDVSTWFRNKDKTLIYLYSQNYYDDRYVIIRNDSMSNAGNSQQLNKVLRSK